jgi:hypothetical protein
MRMDIVKVVKEEITTDPLARGYASMTDEEVLADGHSKYRERNKSSLTGSEVTNAVDVTEFNALTSEQEQRFWNVVGISVLNPFGVESTILTNIFGAGSATIIALIALRKESISRFQELGVPGVKLGHIQEARR